MTTRDYDNFDVFVEAVDDRQFRVRVTQCAVGDTPPLITGLPFSDVQLENLLLKLDPGRAGTRRILDPSAQAAEQLGSGLFEAVFRDDVLVAWSRSVDVARDRRHGVRLRLRLAEAPSLAGLPWEYLYDRRADRFFAQSDRTPVIRYLDVPNPPRPLEVNGPLRILVAISSPHDLAPLQVDKEWDEIHEALAEKRRAGLVVVDRLPQASLAELQRWLRRHEVHVLHFVGHGDFDSRTGEGVVAFTDPLGRAHRVTAGQLGAHVRDHDPLRLVVLNACRTATTDNIDVYSGVAQGLMRQEAAAVVAMQFPITDGAAVVFTTEFYGALADGEPVDQAMTSARKALLADYDREWATPVLFLRAPDGRIFDGIEAGAPTTTFARPETEPPQPTMSSGVQPLEPAGPVSPSWSPTTVQQPPPHPPTGPDSEPAHRPRRQWIALVVALVVIVAGTTVGWAMLHAGKGRIDPPVSSSSVPSTTQPTTTVPPSPVPNPPGRLYPIVRPGPALAYSGPSMRVYRAEPVDRVPGGTSVQLACSVYADPGPNGNPLWYWTNHHWINDHDIDTGRRDSVSAACAGNVNSPTAASGQPSRASGPFGVIGRQAVAVLSSPGSPGQATGRTIEPDTFVTVQCHVAASFVNAPAGDNGSSDWDRLTAGGWIPDADLLTGSAHGSPAPPCEGAGGGQASSSAPPTSSAVPSPTATSSSMG